MQNKKGTFFGSDKDDRAGPHIECKKAKKALDMGLLVMYHVTCLATKGFPCLGNHILG